MKKKCVATQRALEMVYMRIPSILASRLKGSLFVLFSVLPVDTGKWKLSAHLLVYSQIRWPNKGLSTVCC